jgi:glycosyltransferase involved in cell wall biosynthesis
VARLRVLFLSHFVPYPPKGGCFQRNYNLISRLGAEHDVHLLALRHKRASHPGDETQHAQAELLRFCRSVEIIDISDATTGIGVAARAGRSLATGTALSVAIYSSPRVSEAIRRLRVSTSPDIVHFDTIGLAQYLPEAGGLPAIMTHHGAESHMIGRRITHEPNPLKKLFFRLEHARLREYERLMCSRFDTNIVMSDDDANIMRTIAPEAHFTPVENGVDVSYFRPGTEVRHREIVFAGRLDQYSNRDGILYFMREVWPTLRATHSDLVMHIIGNNPPAALDKVAAADSRVKLHGFVPDIRPYFARSMVAICPIRDGGGTRIKVLDALAQGMPIVSTTIG